MTSRSMQSIAATTMTTGANPVETGRGGKVGDIVQFTDGESDGDDDKLSLNDASIKFTKFN